MAIELPPLIQLIKDEIDFKSGNVNDHFKAISQLMPELKRQSEWSLDNFEYSSEQNNVSSSVFSVNPTSGLDPLDYLGKCADLACRVKTALNFSRTFGLYSDIIYLPDSFTDFIYQEEFKGSWNKQEIHTKIVVLKILMPFIEAGIIRFRSPLQPFCSKCMTKFDLELDRITYQMLDQYIEFMDISYDSEYITICSGDMYIPRLTRSFKIRKNSSEKSIHKKIDHYLFSLIRADIRQHLFSMSDAKGLNSTLISNSRLGLGGIQSLDRSKLQIKSPDWEQARTIDLPWVNKLTPIEVIRLRDEASKALPEFREMLFQHISQPQEGSVEVNDKKLTDAIVDLRLQAVEIKKEIEILSKSKEKHFYNLTGVLGLGIGICAAAVSEPLVGVGALMSTLALLHNPLKKVEDDELRLKSKPAYLLLKAKEILEHA